MKNNTKKKNWSKDISNTSLGKDLKKMLDNLPVSKKKKEVKPIKAWADADIENGEILQVFLNKPDDRYTSHIEDTKVIRILITPITK